MRDDDDFNTSKPFARGKGKPATLKPWQSMVNGEIKTTALRCWDGLMGCEAYKPKTAFRLHPLLCDQCTEPLCFRYGVGQSDTELLTQLLHLSASMFRTAHYCKALPDKIKALEKGQEQFISQLIGMIKPMRNRHDIEAKSKAFRDWFFSEIGLEFSERKHVPGFSTVAQGLPVGDRV